MSGFIDDLGLVRTINSDDEVRCGGFRLLAPGHAL